MPFKIIRNDITKMNVDVIVNPTSSNIDSVGQVNDSLLRAGGRRLSEARKDLGTLYVTEAKETLGFLLDVRYVFHTVGPIYEDGLHDESELLSKAVTNNLELAMELDCESIAIPLISTGISKFPKRKAIKIIRDAIIDFINEHDLMVYLVVYDHDSFKLSKVHQYDIPQLITTADIPLTDKYYAKVEKQRERVISRERNTRRTMNSESEFHDTVEFIHEIKSKSLDYELDKIDEGFSVTLVKLIEMTGQKDSVIYKKANIDRRLYSKIRNNPDYQPKKKTAIAFAIALELSLTDTNDLLRRAGYILSNTSKFDLIIGYYINKGEYDIFIINDTLFDFDQELIGSSML